MDYRIQKTKQSLVDALITLLEKQNFNKITVNEICAEAMISRSAFYSHFEDKYALAQFALQTIKDQLFETSEELSIYNIVRQTLSRIRVNSRMLRNLMLNEFDSELIQMIQQSFQNDFERLITLGEVPEEGLPGPVNIVSIYLASGFTSVVSVWIKQDLPYTVDEMTDIMINMLHWL